MKFQIRKYKSLLILVLFLSIFTGNSQEILKKEELNSLNLSNKFKSLIVKYDNLLTEISFKSVNYKEKLISSHNDKLVNEPYLINLSEEEKNNAYQELYKRYEDALNYFNSFTNNRKRFNNKKENRVVIPCVAPIAALLDESTLDICPPSSLTPGSLDIAFDASPSSSSAGTNISRYEWIWGDGTTSITTAPITNHVFPGSGIYEILLFVRDDNFTENADGCISNNAVSKLIRIMPSPDFTNTPSVINVNCGDTTTLTGIVSSQTETEGALSLQGNIIDLPDGTGVSYTSTLNFAGFFPTGDTVTPGCYPTLVFDLEHTYSGDLVIEIIAPTGESVIVFNQHGEDTNFGTCATETDDPKVAGCVAPYTVVDSGGVSWITTTTTTTTSNCAEYSGACEGGDYYISQAYNSTNSFSAFDGADLNGIWTFRITDNLAQDNGVIKNWSLSFPQACFGSSESITPNLLTATWSHTGTGPTLPSQTTTDIIITDPGPDSCPVTGTCFGNQLTNSPIIGPFSSGTGPYTYVLTTVDEFGCEYTHDVTVNVISVVVTPTFPTIGPFCIGELSSTPLPTMSNEGVTGSWTPTFNNTTSQLYTFTPDTGQCAVNTIDMNVFIYAKPTATVPTDMIECDDDNNGTVPFTLTDQNATINTDTGMSITYYLSQSEADIGTTGALTSPYESGSTTIYVRVENDANVDCYDTTSFEIEVYDSAFPSTTVNLLGDCDNTSVGTDSDGFIIFDLTQQETEILNSQSTTEFTLSYFTDAGYTIQIPVGDLTNFTNTVANGQTIYVRMTNNLNTDCFTDTSFEIEVYPLPVLNTAPGIPPYELIQCDDPSNDAEANFNLYQANGDVISPVTTETFIYYTTEALAIAGVPGTEIPDATAYFVTGSVGQVWVRVVTVNGCFRTAMVDLIIRPSQINPDYQLYQCDDFLDVNGNDTTTNDDTDGITYFDFQNEIDLILAPFAGTAGVSVSCHHTEADSDAGINPIDPATYSNYRNNTSASQERIWVRIVSTLGNDCLANGNFITLNVNLVPIANTVSDLESCDNNDDGDDTNGIGILFDLETQSSFIREIGALATDFPITYHLSKSDADSGNNSISSPYTNITNGETIYARVLNVTTGCINAHIAFNLNVNPLPIIDFTNLSLASECDNDDDGDDTNGMGVTFDLGSLRTDFENLQPDTATVNYTVTYHESLVDAEASPGLNPLPDLYPNTVNNQTIFVRIENDDTGCIRIEESPIFLVVNPLPILSSITIAPTCDNDDDGDDTNESVTWNLDNYVDSFTTMQTTINPVSVTFHTTLSGASSTPFTDEITATSAYANISNPEQIFVRVTNDVTGCFRAIHAFDLIVNPLPEYELASESLVCENYLPHEISVESPDASDYLYEWFNSNGVSIGNDQILIITATDDITVEGVDYLVTVTNPTTFCERTKSIRVWKSSIATITDADIVTVEFNSPENSIEVLTANLGSGDYEFALEHPRDSRYYQDEPKFVDLMGGIYTLLVRDKNGCGETSIEVVLIDYPRFLTPNNDSYNDTWQLLGVESAKFTVSPIEIYDRYGKLITVINATDIGWDGTYNGSALPSGGFWFALHLTDQLGKTTLHRGNFSLVRR